MAVRISKPGDPMPKVGYADGRDSSRGTHIPAGELAPEANLELGSYCGADVPPGGAKITVSPMGYLITSQFEGGGEERYAINYNEFNHLKGRLLTLVDAVFTDGEQRKAVKDLVKGEFREWIQDIMRNAARDAGLPEQAFYIGGVFDNLPPSLYVNASEGVSITANPGYVGEGAEYPQMG